MPLSEPSANAGVKGLLNWAKEVARQVLLGGKLIEGVAVTTSAAQVQHKLGRTPKGALVVKQGLLSTPVVYAANEETVTVVSSVSDTISLYIF